MSDDYDKIREAQARAAAQALGGDLARPPEPAPFADQADPPPQHYGQPHQPQPDEDALEARVVAAATKALADMMGGVGGPQSFAEALADVDPADSEAALGMLDFLLKTGRLQRIGVLDGAQGYLFGYVEPKGSTKQGYRPGGTQGDRIVDEALEKQRNSDTKRPARQGMCPKCMTVVAEFDGEIVSENPTTSACSAGGTHDLV